MPRYIIIVLNTYLKCKCVCLRKKLTSRIKVWIYTKFFKKCKCVCAGVLCARVWCVSTPSVMLIYQIAWSVIKLGNPPCPCVCVCARACVMLIHSVHDTYLPNCMICYQIGQSTPSVMPYITKLHDLLSNWAIHPILSFSFFLIYITYMIWWYRIM